MKKYLHRSLALILCVVMCVSFLVTPAGASYSGDPFGSAVFSWVISIGLSSVQDWIAKVKASNDYSNVPGLVTLPKLDNLSTRSEVPSEHLILFAMDWNLNQAEKYDMEADIVEVTNKNNEKFLVIRFLVPFKKNSGSGYYDMYVATPDRKIVCTADSPETHGQWLDTNDVKPGSRYYMLSYDKLYNLATAVGGDVQPVGKYYIISKGNQDYVNLSGLRFAAFAAPTASNTNLPAGLVQDENGNWGIDYGLIINTIKDYIDKKTEDIKAAIPIYDLDGAIKKGTDDLKQFITDALKRLGANGFTLEELTQVIMGLLNNVKFVTEVNLNFQEGAIEYNGVKLEMGDVTYNPETKTYTITTNNTTNNETNYFITNYHINYTSITYIGATEEYNKYFKVYYQLPDGRSSADLTAEELEQMNVDMDVIPYGRSTDSPSVRALYHFDGDTKDSSYWSHVSKFTWNKGASLTYMESGDFGGSLYFDENEHQFYVTLPGTVASKDFTVQFRYYQSHTLTPVRDSWLSFNSNIILRFDGQYLMIGENKLAPIPTGSWNEIAIMRKNGIRYIYLNGVCLYELADTKAYDNRLIFNFGSEQQTYKYIDELRVLDFALAAGEYSQPTSAPHDSNLTLVLPDSVVPVPDAYWEIKSSKENLISAKYAHLSTALESTFKTNVQRYGLLNGNQKYQRYINDASLFPVWCMDTYYTELTSDGSSIQLRDTGPTHGYDIGGYVGTNIDQWTKNGVSDLRPGLYTYLTQFELDDTGRVVSYYFDSFEDYATEFTFSIVNSSGEVASISIDSLGRNVYKDAFGYRFGIFVDEIPSTREDEAYTYYHKVSSLGIVPISNNPDPLVYMQLVSGERTDLTATWVEDTPLIEKDKINVSSLAVKTDIEITSQQIGGVRPSLPERGMVYAMVEGGYIISLQIYDGSGWIQADGRIWTGSRWIPYQAYNVITLQDMFDIVDASDFEHIQTESGFYDWIQRTFKQILTKMDTIIEKLTNLGGGSPDKLPDYEDKEIVYDEDGNPVVDDDGNPVVKDNGWKAVDLFIVIKDGVWSVVTGVVRTGFNGLVGLADGLSHVTTFYDSYSPDSSSGINDMYTYGGGDIWD